MATTLSAQLQVLKSFLQVESEPIKKPFVRASVLFDPKEAADIDLDTIFSISLSGLEALIATDVRFRSFKGSLFSRKSRELDREMMGGEENIKINASIALFLRLLSGYLHLPSALKTLEYLIRRYKVHVYNIEELVLCALPYHDTESFVRIVQLVDLGNNKWRFLEGVKNQGAPLPRKVIVQQCICDMGFLETLCNYALPEKKVQPSREVVCFCTAVVVETLGSVPSLDSDTIKRILPFVFEGLNPVTKGGGSDHKAGAIMIVGLLASRATLSPKLITNLITAIARVAQQDARQSADLSWIRLLVMAIINLVQSQSVQLFPKKGLEFLKDVSDLSGVLMALSKEFNIEKFLSLYLETLVDYSYFDDSLRPALIKTLETALAKEFVENIVIKVLSACMKLLGKTEKSYLHESGSWAKQILVVVNRCYPSELRGAVHKFMEDPKMSLKHDSIFEILCLMLDGGMDMPLEISNLRIWFSLEHPKAGVRRATLSSLAASDLLRAKTFDSQNQINVQDTILRRLRDDDLGVVQAALSLDGLTRVVNPLCLFEAFQDIILRCTDILTGNLDSSSQACNVAISCLDGAILTFQQHQLDSKKIATMVFPLLLILPKTWRLNCKALELVKNIQWPFYSCLSDSYDHMSISPLKKFESSVATSMNVKTVGAMGECLLRNVEEYIPWLVECCNTSKLSKTLFFLVMLQSFMIEKEGLCHFSTLFQACFPVLKNEWHEVEAQGDVLAEEFNNGKLEESCKEVMKRLFDWKISALNSHILICTYWSLLKAANTVGVLGFLVDNGEGVQILDDLFVFSATSSLKNLFMEQLHLLVMKSSISPVQFLSKFFTEEGFSTTVQVTSLHTLTMICSTFMSSHKSGMSVSSQMQLLLGFPSLLVPLASDNQDICTASVNCIKSLHKLSIHIGKAASKSGKDTNEWTPAFGELLSLIIQQQKLISSDVNFLSSLMVSVLCSSSQSLLAPQNIDKRFDLSTKEAILHFILRSAVNFSAYGKLVVFSLFKGMGSTILNVEEVKLLLSELLDRRKRYHIEHDRSCQRLSKTEIDTLCFLLESCGDVSSSTMLESLFKALHVNGVCLEDSAVIRPCVTVLEKLSSAFYDSLTTKVQDELVLELVLLFRNENGDIQDATREALQRINVSWSTIGRLLDLIIVQEHQRSGSMDSKMKRKKSTKDTISDIRNNLFNRGDTVLFFLSSLLDVLLLKKDMVNRISLVEPLFKLLRKIFENDWLSQLVDQAEKESLDSEGYIQQTMLLVLEDISSSLLSDLLVKDGLLDKFDVKLLVECARSAKDVTTRNHVFSLLSSVAKIVPDQVIDHIIDIFTVMGESAISQNDSHSQHVFEDLISTVVPWWLSKTDDAGKLLQIFIDVLPEVAEHRRRSLMVYLMRTLGEKSGLSLLLFLLFRSLAQRTTSSSNGEIGGKASLLSGINNDWEYNFAVQVCEQYSCLTWLPSLGMLLHEIGVRTQGPEQIAVLQVAMRFIEQKLQDTELAFLLESGQDEDDLQRTLGTLMELVGCNLQLVDARNKQLTVPSNVRREFKDHIHCILRTITRSLGPSSYFKAMSGLLSHADENVRKKSLGILIDTVKDHDLVHRKHKEARKSYRNKSSLGIHIDATDWESFNEVCLKIVQLVDDSDSDTAAKLAAVSSLEVLANKFPSNSSIYITCLTSITKYICSDNLALSSGCLRCTGALINVLGPKALAELPNIMEKTLKRAHEVSSCSAGKFKHNCNGRFSGLSNFKESLLLSILVMLDAVIEKLGVFLNPYLEDIIELMVLRREYSSESDLKLKQKADAIRRLLTEKIPVRLILTPLLNIYPKAAKCGESSLSEVFTMLASTIGKMDKTSVRSYHAKIFDQCLLALDLRRQHPVSVPNIDFVEESVIHAIIGLTMKLTETMFRPLFFRSLEWAEIESEEDMASNSKNLDRMLSLYKLVNKLAEQQRSLFVPYFKFLLESCTRYLTDDQESSLTQKRKKPKVQETGSTEERGVLSISQWHLRALILSSLYKCFLYDTGSLKFLDSSKFQVLLRPMVSQLVAEPPASLQQFSNIPSVEEVDDTLVSCLSQMAVAAGTDVLWKSLNHEVLMQTRSEKIRARMLGLRVVKCLLERLKEEYLVFLAETIPFLGELLEDAELSVKSLAQQILQEMEILSGENIKEYL